MLYGGNPYRAKAYLRAADSVALLTEPIGDLIAQNRLREIPGVGEAIAGVITTLFQTGSHPSLEKMRADVPNSETGSDLQPLLISLRFDGASLPPPLARLE